MTGIYVIQCRNTDKFYYPLRSGGIMWTLRARYSKHYIYPPYGIIRDLQRMGFNVWVQADNKVVQHDS